MQPVHHTFHDDTLLFIRNDPVQLRRRKLLAKLRPHKIHFFKFFPCLLNRCTLCQNPWNKFKLCDVFPPFFNFLIHGIADKIKPCHTQSFFIDSIIIQWIIAHYICHTDDRIMRF